MSYISSQFTSRSGSIDSGSYDDDVIDDEIEEGIRFFYKARFLPNGLFGAKWPFLVKLLFLLKT